MKNAMKKLLSLVLVAMLLVSVLPLGAMAAGSEYDVSVLVKDINDVKLASRDFHETAGTNSTVAAYLDATKSGWSDSYTVDRYWFKEAGASSGRQVDSTYEVAKSGNLTIKLKHKDVPLTLTVHKDETIIQYVNETVPYESTVVLDSRWVEKAGYSGVKADVTSGSVRFGESFTATEPRTIDIWIKTAGNNEENNNDASTTENAEKVTLNVYLNDSTTASYTNTDTIAKETTTVKNLLTYWYGSTDGFVQAHTKRTGTVTDINTSINRGETVSVRLRTSNNTSTEPSTPTNPTTPVTETYTVYFYKGTSQLLQTSVAKGGKVSYDNAVTAANLAGTTNFAGWKVENAGNTLTNEAVANYAINSNGIRFYAQYTTTNGSLNTKGRQVLLNIYINGKLTAPAKTVDITNYTIVSDGTLNLDEVETVVDDYYKAGNSNKGFQLDGLYVTAGNSIVNYATDSNKQSSWNINSVFEKFNSSTIAFNVYAPNVTAKTSSTADSSNPKTGDTIFAPVAVLTLSTAALAAVYFISKKRVVR